MSKIDDGGPIYPVQEWNSDGTPATLTLGMSLRDWFAGQWLMGYMANPEIGFAASKTAANTAYEFADAMIAARSKT